MTNMFSGSAMVEEDFAKNRIKCSFAAASPGVTLGFIVAGKAKPMTLLKGNELDPSKARRLELVLRRKKGENKFSEIIVGTEETLNKYRDCLGGLLSDDI